MISYSAQQMFELVNDIEAYPEYMPGCVGAEVLERGDDWLNARLELSRMGLKQSFTTRNTLSAPESMSMSLVDGPFKSLEGQWTFQPLSETACKVVFWLEFNVSNALMAFALPKLMQQVAGEQVDALCKRARQVYA